MPGSRREAPVPTSLATRTPTIRARFTQSRVRNRRACQRTAGPSACTAAGAAGAAVPGPATPDGSGEVLTGAAPARPSGGSGTCFVADTTDRQYNFGGFRVTFDL